MENVLNENKVDTDPRICLIQKEILSMKEACVYLCISQSYMYKLTSSRKIPHYSPMGKLIFFKRIELDEWVLRNKRYTQDQVEEEVISNMKKRIT